jgi:hypothetical protein
VEWFWNGFWATIGYGAAHLVLPLAFIAILGAIFAVMWVGVNIALAWQWLRTMMRR